MIEPDVIARLAFLALIAAVVFSCDRRSVSSFRFLPGSLAEWVAYWFHSLEFISLSGSFTALQRAAHYYPHWAGRMLVWACVGAATLLIISAIAFWRFDRPLCIDAVLWLSFLCVCLLFLYPGFAASE